MLAAIARIERESQAPMSIDRERGVSHRLHDEGSQVQKSGDPCNCKHTQHCVCCANVNICERCERKHPPCKDEHPNMKDRRKHKNAGERRPCFWSGRRARSRQVSAPRERSRRAAQPRAMRSRPARGGHAPALAQSSRGPTPDARTNSVQASGALGD